MPNLSLHVRSFALGALLCALAAGSIRFLSASGDAPGGSATRAVEGNLTEFTTETRVIARLGPTGGVTNYYFVQGNALQGCTWVESMRNFSCANMPLQR